MTGGRLKIIITLIGAAIVTAVGIAQDAPPERLAAEVLIAAAVFFAMGWVIEKFLKKHVFPDDNINIEGSENLTDVLTDAGEEENG